MAVGQRNEKNGEGSIEDKWEGPARLDDAELGKLYTDERLTKDTDRAIYFARNVWWSVVCGEHGYTSLCIRHQQHTL